MKQFLKSLITSLAVIVIAALLIRLGYCYSTAWRKPVPAHFSWETSQIAKSIAEGKGFANPYPGPETGPTGLMAPGYPFLLAGIFKVFGVYTRASYFAAIALNYLFSVLTCIPIFFIAKRLGGSQLAVVSAWMWAIFPNAVVIPTDWIWDTSLTALLVATLLWVTLEIGESRRILHWVGFGMLWGAAIFVNPSVIILLPCMLAWILWRRRAQLARYLPLAAATVGMVVICCVPWAARNYSVFHRFIPFRTNFGLELWLGNNRETQNVQPDAWSPYSNEPLRRKFIAYGEIQFMRVKQAEAIAYISQNQSQFAHATWYRFLETWTGVNGAFADAWIRFPPLTRVPLLFNLFVGLAGIAGLLFLRRQNAQYFAPLAVIPAIYPVVYYLTHPALRYRHPIDPALVVLAAMTITYPFRLIATRKHSQFRDLAQASLVTEPPYNSHANANLPPARTC